MIKNFRTYDLAVEFYRLASSLDFPRHLRDQLLRAASSIALNLAEGDARRTTADRLRFFNMAFGSLKECQAVLDLGESANHEAAESADKLAAHLYRLLQNTR